MKLKTIAAIGILGVGSALASYYSFRRSPLKNIEKTVEVTVEENITDTTGRAFSGEQSIAVINRHGKGQAGVNTHQYTVKEDGTEEGAVYLAGTAQIGGGIAVYPVPQPASSIFQLPESPYEFLQLAQTLPMLPSGSGPGRGGARAPPEYVTPQQTASLRELIIRPAPGSNQFTERAQELMQRLVEHKLQAEYTCEGIFTTQELQEQRERKRNILELISYIDPTGVSSGAVWVYDTLEYFIDSGVLPPDLSPGKEWFVLNPSTPLSFPLTIQRDAAGQHYNASTVMRLEELCSGVQRIRIAGERRTVENGPDYAPGRADNQPPPMKSQDTRRERCIPESVAQGNFRATLNYFGLLSSLELESTESRRDLLLLNPRRAQSNNVFNKISARFTTEFGSPHHVASHGDLITWLDGGCSIILMRYDDGKIGIQGLESYRTTTRTRTPFLPSPVPRETIPSIGEGRPCQPHASYECLPTNGNILWKNSCGEWEDTYQRCSTGCQRGQTSCPVPALP